MLQEETTTTRLGILGRWKPTQRSNTGIHVCVNRDMHTKAPETPRASQTDTHVYAAFMHNTAKCAQPQSHYVANSLPFPMPRAPKDSAVQKTQLTETRRALGGHIAAPYTILRGYLSHAAVARSRHGTTVTARYYSHAAARESKGGCYQTSRVNTGTRGYCRSTALRLLARSLGSGTIPRGYYSHAAVARSCHGSTVTRRHDHHAVWVLQNVAQQYTAFARA